MKAEPYGQILYAFGEKKIAPSVRTIGQFVPFGHCILEFVCIL